VATTGHRRAPQVGAGESGPTPARRILDERYARGELDTEEYRERVSALGG
jgi:putative membrane protein